MDFKSLEVLMMVYSELHFGMAAKKLFMSQSSVSEYIKRLENELGGELFKRSSRKVEPTTICINLVEQIKLPVSLIKTNLVNTKKEFLGLKGKIRFGFLGGGFYDKHADLEKHLERFYSEVQVQFIETDYESHFSSILDKEVDIGICRAPIDHEELVQSNTLFSDERMVCLPINHHLAHKELIDLEDLVSEKILIPNNISLNTNWFRFHFPLVTPSGHTISTGEGITTVREGILSVASGKGVFFIASKAVNYYRSPDVCFVKTSLPKMTTKLGWRKNDNRALIHKIAKEIELFFKETD